MEDLTLRYFDAEMRYLRDAAREFALLHPEQAAQMGLSTPGAVDSAVEQLFQGFAFLSGRLREKLDDDYPELTEGVISLLWPHALRPLPSACVVEIAPDADDLKISDRVTAHSEVVSQPVGDKAVRCRYRTTRDLMLNPLALRTAGMVTEHDGRHMLRMRFQCGRNADWQQIDLRNLPFYLHGDTPLTSLLHLYLTRRVAGFYIRLPGNPDRQPFKGRFRASGFDESAGVWPVESCGVESVGHAGHMHLLEYFTFREKFMFLELSGLETIDWPEMPEWFELDIVFREFWPSDFSFDEANLRLHCVPVVNLFRLDARPLMINGHQADYPLRPLRDDDPHTEIFAVEQVASSFAENAPVYTPFRHFQHCGGMLRDKRPARYYHTRIKRGPSGRTETTLTLGGDMFELERHHAEEPLALSLTGTNGMLPRKILQNVLLDTLDSTTQASVRVQNLSSPTMVCYPPQRDRFHWQLLSQTGSSFLWVMDDAEVLRNTLKLHCWSNDEVNQRRLDGITCVKHWRLQKWQRYLKRGVDIEVTLNTDHFAGEGDVWLFGSLINRFLAQFADEHLYNRLTLILQPSGKCLRWKENHS
ncbi:type VI secretion system baseplate subunit TssF [Pantoea sp. FN060301]|uniref:type VI secretion system baseplate subunit TssF n=1 Tax=Pantoea sp. FN060301 TaxID=3420380 RepID=UPI003D17CA6D